MTWYKKAKLIDIDPPQSMTLHCMYCDRWATTDQENVSREAALWKKEKDLNPEERNEIEITRRNKMYSSGICPTCRKITTDFLQRHVQFTKENIRALSLLFD